MQRSLLAVATLALSLALWPAHAGPSEQPQSCMDCHQGLAAAPGVQRHMSVRPFEVNGRVTGCEGCHGDGTRHRETGDAADIRRFDQEGGGDGACLECHQRRGAGEWHASTHAAQGVSCVQCHAVHKPSRPLDACRSCHSDVAARFQMPSRHPVREGKMSCSSCHDVHSANEGQLRVAGRPNELCYRCHQEKEGPYVFEHQPVQEDCRLCHDPHGATARNLLTANEPMLCLQCHEFHFHGGYQAAEGEIEIGGIRRESPFGASGLNVSFNTRCSQCHTSVHGSDLPSQGISGRGGALTR